MLWESLHRPSRMGSAARCLTEAHGCTVRFADGTEAWCLTSGLWNVNFGYGNATVAARVERAVRGMHYATLFRYWHPEAREAADALLERLGWSDGALVYSTSGSAMNDTVVKLARQWNALVGRAARTIVTVAGSYHGMTLTAMQLSGEDLGQALYGARSAQVVHLPPDDPEPWRSYFAARGDSVALVVLEPVLGSGAIPVSPEVVATVLAARDQHGFLVSADEVATGFFRLGHVASSVAWPSRPDLVGLSKGLTNGTEASSVVAMSARVSAPFLAHDATFLHGETQAGSPMATAAILGVLEVIEAEDVHGRYGDLQPRVEADLDELARRHGLHRRGQGLFHHLGWSERGASVDPLHVVDALRHRGVVVQPSSNGLQVVPQVTMGLDEWASACERLDDGLAHLASDVAGFERP